MKNEKTSNRPSFFILLFSMNLAIIILAAGKGTRMKSDLAKVLHPLCGKPLIAWVLEATQALEPQRTVVVVGHQAAAAEAAVRERFDGIEFVTQPAMLGTGHAVQQAEELLKDFDGDILVTCGDVPLITTETLRRLADKRHEHDAAASMLVATIENPGSYGRVLCEPDGRVTQIVEAKDATPEIIAVKNVNAGTYCFASHALWEQLGRITNENKSGEYYLTDVVGLLTAAGQRVNAVFIDEREMTGINTREELEALEAQLL
ncbi:MAG: NTP transferase domain-containing protein, partial [Armatimonadota bacterium]|nr:NTP transferase domain-containing protein [Armatimonadota bacterium]